MPAKSNKIEHSEEFMVMWREQEILWDVMSPLHRDKNEKYTIRVFFKKVALRNFGNSQKILCQSLFIHNVAGTHNF